MKKDLRRQTFSKPEKPSDDEIRRLTSDETPELKIKDEGQEKKVLLKTVNSTPKKTVKEREAKPDGKIEGDNLEKINPFLLSRGQNSNISIEKTGYRLRSDYMDLLKLVKRIKKGYTLEAVLDDALTFYFENSEDGRKAVKQRTILDAE